LSGRTAVSRLINAPCPAVYRAFLDPQAVATWLPPDSMTGIVHVLEPREGGAFRMSLIYPPDEAGHGKSAADTDTFAARFVALVPDESVVWAVTFESTDPAFAGEMTVRTTLEPAGDGTRITMLCENIPSGIRPQDNEAGCRSTLDKLAAFVERRPKRNG
jgi:uncharacterized protein YndB with AHSA1/START domain